LSTTEELPSIAAHRSLEPKKLSGLVRGELDWIVMKALDKDRNRRYETANGLAHDIGRYLKEEPVEAGPPSKWYRLRKLARRNKAALAAGFSVSVALVVAVVTLVVSNIRIREEKERAEQGYQLACRAVDDYFIRVSENKLLDVPGLQPLRQELLKTALEYYRTLAGKRSHDPAIRAELAKAHFRLGVITLAIASKAEALAAYEQARDLQEALLQDHRDDAELRADLASTYEQIGLTQQFLGRTDEALYAYEQERALWAQLSQGDSGKARFVNGLAGTYDRVGETKRWLGRYQEALAAAETSRQLRAELVQRHPDDPRLANRLAGSHMQVGESIKPRLGVAAFEKARVLREQLAQAHPGVLEFELDLAYTYRKLGEAYRMLDEPEKALASYERARPILQKLARESPTVTDFQHKLAFCYSGLAHMHWAKERPAEAAEFFLRAAAIVRAILLTAPESTTLRHDLALMHHYAGLAKFEVGRLEDAEGLLRFAADVWAKVVREQPELPEIQRCFADNCDALGDLLDETGRQAGARLYYQQAYAVYQGVARDHPGALTLGSFANFLATCGNAELRDAKRAVGLAAKAVELAPGYEGALGVAQYRAGQYREAAAALRKAVSLRKDGGTVSDWLYLAMAHGRLGNQEEGLQWYQKAVNGIAKQPWQSKSLRRLQAEAEEVLRLKASMK
jgi:tetratricopeptide (TPR) repeat protein